MFNLKTIVVTLLFSEVLTQFQADDCNRSYDNLAGRCVPLTQCPKSAEEFQSGIVQPDICAYIDDEPVICCPFQYISSQSSNSGKRISVEKCEEYSKLAIKKIPFVPLVINPQIYEFTVSQCDYSTALIVGGEEAKLGEFPHMAAIGWTENGIVSWKCGGSIISPRFILTAAHCVSRELPDIIRLGDHNLASTSDNADPKDFGILQIIKHPDYKRPKYYNDIALIKLQTDIRFSKFIRPACLWQTAELNYTKAVATGWGQITFAGDQSDTLLKVVLDIISNRNCQQYYETNRRLPTGIIDTQMCVGHLKGGKDTCQGDSGGPIQVSTSNECIFHIIGVTSFGKFCAAENSPGVYTRVSSYIDWIELIVVFKVTKQEDTIFFHEADNHRGDSCKRKADNAIGKCVPDRDCLNAGIIYKKYGIRPDICEFRNRVPIICCSDKNLYNQVDARAINEEIMHQIPNGISDHKCYEYSHSDHLKQNYRKRDVYNPKYDTVESTQYLDHEYPHIGAVGWTLHNSVAWNCGCSLISEKFVITTAHCTDTDLGKPDLVRFGEHDLREIIKGVLPNDYLIIEIVKYPGYKTTSHYHDIALMRLNKDVIFSETIRPACLWQTYFLNNTFGRVLSWEHSEYGEKKSDILSKIDLDFYDNEQCDVYFPPSHKLESGIQLSQLCAGDSSAEKQMNCPHHSTNYLEAGFGGPIQIKILSKNMYVHYIIGMKSFGKYCDSKSLQVFTRISSFIPWIESVVWP